jgi:outer membrane protein assembly factor BamB
MKRPANAHDPITLTGLRTMNAGHGSFLTRKHKLAIIGGASVVALCIGGTLWYRHTQRVNAEQMAWNAAYDQAMDQKNRAEASLVYGDDEGSLRLVQQADGILSRLDSSTTKRAEARKTLETALASVHAKLRKEQRVDQPRSLFTLPAEAGNETLSLLGSSGGKLYTFDTHSKQIIITEVATNVVKQVGWTETSLPVALIAENTTALLLTADKKAFRVDAIKGTMTAVPYSDTQSTTISNAVIYAKRVYALDPTGNMIWRHNLGTSIGPGTAYIKQTSISLAGATSIAIDSNVYVGFANGQIVRYLSGAQEAWSPLPIDPPLSNIVSLWTSPDSDRLLVADQQGKRIVILRKDGKLVSQIVSSAFKGPTSVTADTTLKQLFVTDGGSIYGFDLP